MTEDPCVQLINLLHRPRSLTETDKWTEELKSLDGVENCIYDGLTTSLATRDWQEFDRYVIAAFFHPATTMTAVLCEVLDMRPEEVTVENIVEALGSIKDPRAVNSLVRTLEWPPDWDEFDGVAQKCLWALGAIGSAEAIHALQQAARSDRPVVREFANFELHRLR